MSGMKRYRRFNGWDYSRGASFFITIATVQRRALLGRVIGGKTILSPLGEKVMKAIEEMPRLNPGLSLFGRVVMPDHVHFNCCLRAGLKEPLKVLGFAIRRFKNYTTKMAKLSLAIRATEADAPGNSHDGQTVFGQLWQKGYHDYLLTSRKMIDSTERYIAYNPPKWELMYGVPASILIREPLSSPRLNLGDYWKGVGNTALLGDDMTMLSLRVSREVRSSVLIAALIRSIESAVAKGYVIISGFISKGEQAVRDMLCRRKDARFIHILPSSIPNARFKPESCYVTPFAEGRYLEIAQGNGAIEFGRRACLDLNAEIIEIATACDGVSLYWKTDGPHVLADSRNPSCDAAARVDGRIAHGQKEKNL